MSKDRKTTIADAALELLGSVGAREPTLQACKAMLARSVKALPAKR
jgi:hypothetical protein